MNLSLMPSLEHMALVKTVTTLWNHGDVRALLTKFHSIPDNTKKIELWRKAECCVTQNTSLLQQPGPLKEKILGAIRPIGYQMLEWVNYNTDKYDFAVNLKDRFYWTPMGTVDKKKMAEVLMRNQKTIAERYKVACAYCLENDAEELWRNMPEYYRILLRRGENLRDVEQYKWQFFWARDDNKEAFTGAADDLNEVAVKYFWNKLTSEERQELIARMPEWQPPGVEIGYFLALIPLMDDEQQLKMMENSPVEIINIFLDWPYQNLCMEVVNRVWDFLSVDGYCFWLGYITLKVQSGYKDCDYQELFKQLWKQSPTSYKRYVINHYAAKYLLGILLEIRDEKSIKLILKYATPEEKRNILFHSITIRNCKDLVYTDQWNLLKFFISECASSGEEMEIFKDKYMETSVKFLDGERSPYNFSDTLSLQEKQVLDEQFIDFLNDLAKNCYKNRGIKRNCALMD